MFDFQTKDTRPAWQMTGHNAEWLNNKKHEASDILGGRVPGYTPRSAIGAAERIISEILADGFPEYQVSTIRMRINEVRQNLSRPLMLGEDAFSKMITPGGD